MQIKTNKLKLVASYISSTDSISVTILMLQHSNILNKVHVCVVVYVCSVCVCVCIYVCVCVCVGGGGGGGDKWSGYLGVG